MKLIKLDTLPNQPTFSSVKELTAFAIQQTLALAAAEERISELENALVIVKNTNVIAIPPVKRIEKSVEEIICERQLEELNNISMTRELTFEETKKLDLFVKNLHVARDKNAKIISANALPEGITETQLIEFAAQGNNE